MLERPPAYVSKARLAAELDISVSTVDEHVRRGILPRPFRLSGGCLRWRWIDVENAISSLLGGDASASDPYMQGAIDATRKQD